MAIITISCSFYILYSILKRSLEKNMNEKLETYALESTSKLLETKQNNAIKEIQNIETGFSELLRLKLLEKEYEILNEKIEKIETEITEINSKLLEKKI